MKEQHSVIKCPKCGTSINVSEVIYHQLEDEFKVKLDLELAKERKKLDADIDKLEKEKKGIEKTKLELQDSIDSGIRQGLKTEQKKIENKLRKQLDEETSDQIMSMQKELKQKSQQLKEFNKAKAQIERLKREKEEVETSVQAKLESEFSERLKKERSKLQKAEAEKALLTIDEREEVIKQLRKQLAEAQRKAEQGSTQLQGEVQELSIESWLREQFPLDTIEEIKKGARGGDCIVDPHSSWI